MFNSKHYVPMLKWKRAEQGALEVLTSENKKYITPVIQFVMPKQKPQDTLEDVVARFKKQSTQIPDRIIEVWGNEPIFIDFSLLFTTELKVESIKSISISGHQKHALFILVIHINDEKEIKDAVYSTVKETKSGLCLRLICTDLLDLPKLNSDITGFISGYKLEEEEIDLLIDIKELECDKEKYKKYFNLSQGIVNLSKWRTYIFSGGAFPENLSLCKIDEENLIQRLEWKNWKEQYINTDVIRKPAFSDYTIQYPIYKDASQFFHPTSSIKYSLDEEWLVMKGKKQKFELYLASAAELIKDSRYYGKNFSFGDKFIYDKAKHFPVYIKKPRLNATVIPKQWLKPASTNNRH